MPQYDFKCKACSEKAGETIVFSATQGMNDERVAACPDCGEESRVQIFSSFTIHEGTTRAFKEMGVPKERIEKGKFLRDARDKRKREYGPGTYEGESNELWTGSHVPKGIV